MCARYWKIIAFFYPRFTHDLFLPTFYPRFTHVCPRFTHVLPMFTHAQVLPTFYPRFTHVLSTLYAFNSRTLQIGPKLWKRILSFYPRFTHDLPTPNDGGIFFLPTRDIFYPRFTHAFLCSKMCSAA